MVSLKTSKTLTEAAEHNCATDAVAILKGLKNQAKFFLEYVKNKSQQKMDDYSNQRD